MRILKLSLNFKLILVIVGLMAATLGYLLKTSLTMQVNDSLHNAFQNQLTENKLVAEKISSKIDASLNTLKNIASIKPNPEDVHYQEQMKAIISNQNDLNRIYLVEVPLVQEMGQDLKIIYKSSNEFGQSENDLVTQWIVQKFETLKNQKLSFANLTGDRGSSQVGIMLGDWEYDANKNKVLILVGLMNLADLSNDLPYYLEVADNEGWLLYSSDITGIFSRNIKDTTLFAKATSNVVNSGTLEFEQDEKKELGSFFKTRHNLVVMASQPMIKVMSAIYELIQKIIIAGIIALCIGIIFAVKLSRSITQPIENLCEATEQISEGNFDITVPEQEDEVGILAKSFTKMSKKLQALLKEQVEKVRLEQELNIASTVQKTLLPESDLENESLKIKSFYAPAAECGGDIWQYFIKDRKMVIMIADATGHGLGSAFVTVAARTVFSIIKSLADRDSNILNHPSFMLEEANNAIYDVAKGKIMMTLFLGIIDLDSGECKYVNAGHNPPWLFRKNGKTEALTSPSVRLGEKEKVEEFTVKTITINPEDSLFLYTDGITEGTNTAGEMFGKKQVRKLLEANIASGTDKCFNTLISEFKTFSAGKSFDDDVTAVLLEMKKNSKKGVA